MVGYLSSIQENLGRKLAGIIGREKFTAGHLDIFAEDLDYLFQNTRGIMAKTGRWGREEDDLGLAQIARYTERNQKIFQKLERLYKRLDINSYSHDLKIMIACDMDEFEQMMAACRDEVIGEKYMKDHPMLARPLTKIFVDATFNMIYKIVH